MDQNPSTPKQQNILAFAVTNFGVNLLFSFPPTFLFHFFTGAISEGGLGFDITQDSLRYLLIAIGLILGIFCGPLFGYINQFMSYDAATIYLIIVYIIYTIFVNAFYTPYSGLMAEITLPENRLKMSGLFSLLMGLGTATGLVIPWIIHSLTNSWVMVCLTYALILIVVSMVTVIVIKEPPNPADEEKKERIPYKDILKNRRFLIFESAQFCWNLAFNLVLAALPAIAAAVFGLETATEFGGLALVLLVILGVFFLMYIRKGDKWGKQRTMTFALLYMALIFPFGTIFFYTKTSTVFPILYQGIIFIAFLAVGLAAIFVFPTGILLDIIQKNQEASYMGTNGIFMNTSGALGTIVIFAVTQSYGPDAFFVVCPILSFILLIAGMIFLFFPLYEKPKPP
jgi:Na+/melibiose symporter-like transporter